MTRTPMKPKPFNRVDVLRKGYAAWGFAITATRTRTPPACLIAVLGVTVANASTWDEAWERAENVRRELERAANTTLAARKALYILHAGAQGMEPDPQHPTCTGTEVADALRIVEAPEAALLTTPS